MRAVIYSTVLPAIVGLGAAARSVGIEPVAVITPRAARNAQAAARRDAILASAPEGLDLCFASDKASLERLTRAYEPELGLCTGYPWLLPPEVLSIPRLGVVNTHPSRLPRLRGPYPFAWAIREGDDEIWLTAHLMDEQFDTGPILAQGSRRMPADTSMDGLGPTLGAIAEEVVPRRSRRVVGRPRRPADRRGRDLRGALRRGLRDLDPARRALTSSVRCGPGRGCSRAPSSARSPRSAVGALLVRAATLDDPGDADVPRLDASDGPLWLTSVEPL